MGHQKIRVVIATLVSGSTILAPFPGLGATALNYGAPGPNIDYSQIGPGFDPTKPPQYDIASIGNQGQLFQACSSPLQTAVKQSVDTLARMTTRGAKTSAVSATGACVGNDEAPDPDRLSCDAIKSGGFVDVALVRSKMDQIDFSLGYIQCKKGKFDAVKAKLGCMRAQAEMLAQQLTSMQEAYQQNATRQAQDVSKMDGVIADRAAQSQDVLEKLGDEDHGINGMRKRFREALHSMEPGKSIPAQVRDIERKMSNQKLARRQLEDAVRQRTMEKAAECFSTRKVDSLRCFPDGVENNPPVTAKEFLLCRFRQQQTVDSRGRVERNKNLNAEANSEAQALGALLDQILSETPKSPGAPAGGQGTSVPVSTLLTVADIESQYGDRLARYNGNGLDVSGWVARQLGNCFQRATNEVSAEKGTSNSNLFIQQNTLNEMDTDLRVTSNTALRTYAGLWTDAMKSMTGLDMPLNLSKCTEDSPQEVQVGCLKDLERNMNVLLEGSAKQSGVTMLIKGSDPQGRTHIQFNCQGLNGCAAALENVNRNLRLETQRVQNFKRDYIVQAKTSTDNFTKQMAAMMSAQSSALTARLQELNAELASVGASPIKFDSVKGEPQELDENGLPRPPQSALKLIGSQMSPPMLDVQGDSFAESLEGMKDSVKDIQEKEAPLKAAKARLEHLRVSCAVENVREYADKAGNTLDAMANCGGDEQFCGTNSMTALGRLQVALGEMNLGPDVEADLDQRLTMGMDSCAAHARQKEKEEQELEKQAEKFKNASLTLSTGAGSPRSCQGVTGRLTRDLANIGRARGALGGGGGDDAGEAN